MSERIYRDPVHNIIRLRTDTDEGELMMRLIDTPEFQRLRHITSKTLFKLIKADIIISVGKGMSRKGTRGHENVRPHNNQSRAA